MSLTIAELAESVDVSRDTLRYYERLGLVRPSGRSQPAIASTTPLQRGDCCSSGLRSGWGCA
jgi:hypothetical protein